MYFFSVDRILVSIKDVALVAGLGILVFLVTRAGRDLAGALGELEFPEISLPGIGDINFPSFEFPNIFGEEDISSSIAGMTVPSGDTGTTITIPEDTIVNPDGTVTSSTPPILNLSPEDEAIALAAREENRQRQAAELALAETSQFEFGDAEIIAAQNEIEFRNRQEQQMMQEVQNQIVQSEISGQQFMGEGPSFIGGTVFNTPVERLSFNQIIGMGLAESASGASNLRAIAQGFTPEQEAFLNQPGTIGGDLNQVFLNASRQEFTGLTPEEISLMLTGGVISNF